jgi:hypothetical protein
MRGAAAAPADADEADDNASAQGQALKINWEVLDQP